jgi:hypothetical protein
VNALEKYIAKKKLASALLTKMSAKAVTFSPAMDKSPLLKGKQSKLPDNIQSAILKKKKKSKQQGKFASALITKLSGAGALKQNRYGAWVGGQQEEGASSYPIGQGRYFGAGKLPPTSATSPDGGPRVKVKIPGGMHTLPPQLSQDWRRMHPSNKKGTDWPELVNQKAVQDLSQDMTAYKKRDTAAEKAYQAGRRKRFAQEAYEGEQAAARIKALPDAVWPPKKLVKGSK